VKMGSLRDAEVAPFARLFRGDNVSRRAVDEEVVEKIVEEIVLFVCMNGFNGLGSLYILDCLLI
jgi:hypothetical protein